MLPKAWDRGFAPRFLFLLRVLPALAIALIWGAPQAAAPVGKAAPDFTLAGLSRSQAQQSPFDSLTLSRLKGEVVLIDFWASWCAPCKRSLPALRRLKSEWPSATFLAISVDEDRGKAKRFLESSDPEGLVTLHDQQGQVAERFAIEGMPTVVLVDRKGVVRFRHDGYTERDMKKIELELQVLLKEK